MKRLIGVTVAVALCGLFWVGCQKAEKAPEAAAPAPMAQPAVPPPPPPPPPPPAEGEGN